jgi:hypothetical protein
VARHSFLRTELSEREQALFDNFSYVAPEERFFLFPRRRTSSGGALARRMSRSGSGSAPQTGAPASVASSNSNSSPLSKEAAINHASNTVLNNSYHNHHPNTVNPATNFLSNHRTPNNDLGVDIPIHEDMMEIVPNEAQNPL